MDGGDQFGIRARSRRPIEKRVTMKNKVPHIIAVVLSLFIGLLLPCKSAGQEQPKEGQRVSALIKNVQEDLKAGRVYEALRKLRQTLRRNPNFADAHYYLGVIYSRMDQDEVALRHFRKAVELSPEAGAYHNKVGSILYDQRKFHEAHNVFHKALEGKLSIKNRVNVWRNLGAVHSGMYEWDEAIEALHRSIELDAKDTETRIMLGQVFLALNRLEEAIGEFTSATRLEPERVEAHTFLGVAYSRAGKFAEAIGPLHKAIALDPENQVARYNLARNLIRMGHSEEGQKELAAFKKLQKEAQEEENLARARITAFRSAISKLDENKLEEAKAFLRQVLVLDPHSVAAHYNMGFVLLKQSKYDEGIPFLQKTASLDPMNADAYFYLGVAYFFTGKLEQALEMTKRAIIINEEIATYHEKLGGIYLKLNRKVEATRAFEKALEVDEKFLIARLRLGNLAGKEGKFETAIGHFKAAVEINGGHTGARRLLGLAYYRNGQYDEGIREYREAVRLSPGNEVLRKILVEALIKQRKLRNAEQTIEEWIKAFPASRLAYYYFGQLYYSQGNWVEAMGRFQKAIELNGEGELDRIYGKIGDIYVNQVKLDKAITSYGKALEINPNLLEAQIAMGEIYLRSNRYEEAVAVSQKALNLDPKNSRARHTLERALIHIGKTEEGKK